MAAHSKLGGTLKLVWACSLDDVQSCPNKLGQATQITTADVGIGRPQVMTVATVSR